MFRAVACAIGCCIAMPVQADVILACTFPELPDAVMTFPNEVGGEKTMVVGSRPAVRLEEGQGSGRLISAEVDGYEFRFAPANSVMDVEKDGALILSEKGDCITIGGPVAEAPLIIEAPVMENAAATTAAPTAPEAAKAEAPPTEAAESPTDTGRWQIKQDSSAFDDSRTVVLTLDSTEPIRGRFGGAGPASLILRCMENTTSVYLWLNGLYLTDIQGFGSVDYRIDDLKASSLRMGASTDNEALGLWNGGTAIPFAKELLEGERVVFRATPFNESPVEFSFEVSGLSAAILPLREACKW